MSVALYVRAWVEIGLQLNQNRLPSVALYVRAWVEINRDKVWIAKIGVVALYVRAWVEIGAGKGRVGAGKSRPLREGVGRNAFDPRH